jgi:hypothetical protein
MRGPQITWRPTSLFMLFSKPEDEAGEECVRFSLPSAACKPSRRLDCDGLAVIIVTTPQEFGPFFPQIEFAIRGNLLNQRYRTKVAATKINKREKSKLQIGRTLEARK